LSNTEKNQEIAACKAGLDPKTARKYLALKRLPSEGEKERSWRTREDPFQDVWVQVRQHVEENPGLEAKTLFEWLQREHPGRFSDGQIRTLQRRIKLWRATEGPAQEVYFGQKHEPGKLCASGLHAHDRIEDHDPGADIGAPGVPLRADVLELGSGHDLLLRESGEVERRMAERGPGVGRRAGHTAPTGCRAR